METNPYKYDRNTTLDTTTKSVVPEQACGSKRATALQSQNKSMPQRDAGQKPGTQAKMPKARALALANTLKRTLAVASIIGFGMFGGLVAMHQVGTTTTQSTQSTSGSSNTSSNSNSSSQNSNNFFNQQGGNTSGTSSTSSNSTSSTPVTGTSTS